MVPVGKRCIRNEWTKWNRFGILFVPNFRCNLQLPFQPGWSDNNEQTRDLEHINLECPRNCIFATLREPVCEGMQCGFFLGKKLRNLDQSRGHNLLFDFKLAFGNPLTHLWMPVCCLMQKERKYVRYRRASGRAADIQAFFSLDFGLG